MKTKKNFRSTSRKVQIVRCELWILDTIFQPWCNITHRYLGLSFIFWAAVCVMIFIDALVVMTYRGIYIEHDPLVIAPVCIAIIICVIPQIKTIIKSRYDAYDDLMYGRKNQNRYTLAQSRQVSLNISILIIIFNTVLMTRSNSFDMIAFIMWIFLAGYPLNCFCSCSLYHRRS